MSSPSPPYIIAPVELYPVIQHFPLTLEPQLQIIISLPYSTSHCSPSCTLSSPSPSPPNFRAPVVFYPLLPLLIHTLQHQLHFSSPSTPHITAQFALYLPYSPPHVTAPVAYIHFFSSSSSYYSPRFSISPPTMSPPLFKKRVALYPLLLLLLTLQPQLHFIQFFSFSSSDNSHSLHLILSFSFSYSHYSPSCNLSFPFLSPLHITAPVTRYRIFLLLVLTLDSKYATYPLLLLLILTLQLQVQFILSFSFSSSHYSPRCILSNFSPSPPQITATSCI